MTHSGNITDTNTITETCDNKFEFDVASVSFAPDVSHLPLSENVEYANDSTDKEPIQLKIESPGYCPERPLSLSEFIDIFYKSNKIGQCSDICYPLIDITNSTKRLLIPALCDINKLNELVKEQNGNVWGDITLKSFGRSPWWQSIELSTSMAGAIAELNCRHNVFCKKIATIMRKGLWDSAGNSNGNAMRDKLPDWDDVDGSVVGSGLTNKIPSLADLIQYLDAWCGVLSVARQLGYIPKSPKNKVPLSTVCHPITYESNCCNRECLFKDELCDLVPELCENIKNIKALDKLEDFSCNKYTFLHWNDDAPNAVREGPYKADDDGGFTTRINCGEAPCDGGPKSTRKTATYEDRFANPTGYEHVSGLLKLIEMGLLDWNGCLAGRDDENSDSEKEIKDDLASWKKWFVELQGEETCGYDYDSSHIIPTDRNIVCEKRKNTMGISFLLKLSTLRFASNTQFKNILCVNKLKNTDDSCYDYSQTLNEYFNPISDDKNKLVNNCKFYSPCKRMNIKKNIIKSNKNLKHSILRLCGCSLTKDELLTTISDYIVRDMNAPGGGINKVINAKFNMNFCREGNGIENVVMYDINVNVDLGIYITLASACKDKDSVDKVLKYVFNNPNNDILGSVAEKLLVELQTSYPSCYPAGFNQTQITEYGAQIYENVLSSGHAGLPNNDATNGRNAPNMTMLSSNKFYDCFKTKPLCLAKSKETGKQKDCLYC